MGSGAERKQFVEQVHKACKIAREAAPARARGRTAWSASTRPAGPGDWAKDPERQPEEDRRDLPPGRRRRRGPRRAARRRGRDLLGRHALVAADGAAPRDGRAARDRRLPGRHGAHAALHDGLQRARGRDPARRITTGRTRASSTRRCKKLTAALRPWTIDFHVAQNNATVHGTGSHDKTGRHCLRHRPHRQARHPPPRRLLAAGTRAATRSSASATSAGTAACSPTR